MQKSLPIFLAVAALFLHAKSSTEYDLLRHDGQFFFKLPEENYVFIRLHDVRSILPSGTIPTSPNNCLDDYYQHSHDEKEINLHGMIPESAKSGQVSGVLDHKPLNKLGRCL